MFEEKRIQEELIKMGANPSLKGFQLIPCILNLMDKEITNGNQLDTSIYEMVGREKNCTPSSVERSLKRFFKDFKIRIRRQGGDLLGIKGTNEDLFFLYYKFKEN